MGMAGDGDQTGMEAGTDDGAGVREGSRCGRKEEEEEETLHPHVVGGAEEAEEGEAAGEGCGGDTQQIGRAHV